MKKTRAKSSERFVGIPHWVLRDEAYRAASHRARALLLDICLQYDGRNNGKLTACDKALRPLGWKSNDGVTKAKRELIDLYLLIETRRGARPNRAAWYALSWRALDITEGLDINPRQYVTLGARKIAGVTPSGGVAKAEIAPSHGVRSLISTPSRGAIRGISRGMSTPPHGEYVDVAIPTDAATEDAHG